MSQKPQQTGTSDVIKVRYEKLDALKEAGRDPFVITTSARDVLTETIKNNFEEYENKDVCVAGRLLSKRGKGKVSFMDLWDRSGKIQIFAKFDDLGEEEYGFLKKWDIGDIVEVKGFVFMQKRLSSFLNHSNPSLKSITVLQIQTFVTVSVMLTLL